MMTPPAWAGTKIAVYFPASPDLERLVASELSRNQGIKTLGRSDLPEITAQWKRDTRMISGADYVISYEQAEEPILRISEGGSGAVLYAEPVPDLDPHKTAEWMTLRLRDYLRTTTNPAARRIDFQGFRFDTNLPSDHSWERRLNLAVSARLQHSGRVHLLENWRGRDHLFEESLKVDETSPFWKNAEHVDVSLSRSADKLTAVLTVRPANGSPAKKHMIPLPLSDLKTAAKKLADAILGDHVSPPKIQDREKFLWQAEWLLLQDQPSHALEMAETAIALGMTNREFELVRMRAYSDSAYPDGSQTIRPDRKGEYSENAIPLTRMAFAVDAATESLVLAREWLKKQPSVKGPDKRQNDEDQASQNSILANALRVLRAAHSTGHHRDHAAEVEALRFQTQQYIVDSDGFFTGINYPRYHDLRLCYAPYWNRTPEETIAFYRRMLDRKYDAPYHVFPRATVRSALRLGYLHDPLLTAPEEGQKAGPMGIPRLIAWRESDQPRLVRIWADYIDELSRSESPLTQADALAFRWSHLPIGQEKLDLITEAVDFAANNTDALTGPDGELIFQQLNPILRRTNSETSLADAHSRYVDLCEKLLQTGEPIPGLILPRLSRIDYFFPNEPFISQIPGHPEKAREVFARQNKKWAERRTIPFITKYRAYAKRLLSALRSHRSRLSPDVPKTYVKALSSKEEYLLTLYPELANRADGDALIVNRAWLRSEHTSLPIATPLQEHSLYWHEGRIWAACAGPARILTIDPTTFETEILKTSPVPMLPLDGTFQIVNNQLFIPASNGVWKLDLASRRWSPIDLPANTYRTYHANGAIWAVFGQSPSRFHRQPPPSGLGVYRIDLEDGRPKLIFHTWRRPAEHPLDKLERDNIEYFFSGEDGQPVFGFHDSHIYHISNGEKSASDVLDSETYQVNTGSGDLFIQETNSSRFPGLPTAIFVTDSGRAEHLFRGRNPTWEYPPKLHNHTSQTRAAFAGGLQDDRFYLLAMDRINSPLGATNSNLYVFQRGKKSPAIIPLEFSLSSTTAPAEQKDLFEYPFIRPQGFLVTPKGIALSGYGMDGFWFIPIETINAWIEKAEASQK